jgi:nitrate/nitrite transporter NarK
MASVMGDGGETARLSARAEPNTAASAPTPPLVLATVSFALSFAVWGLVGGLAPVHQPLLSDRISDRVARRRPVLLGSLARLPMGMLTDRFGGRLVFTALLGFSSLAAFVLPLTASYPALLLAAFLFGMAGSSFAVGAAFVSRWTAAARQGTALGIYGTDGAGITSHVLACTAAESRRSRRDSLVVELGGRSLTGANADLAGAPSCVG